MHIYHKSIYRSTVIATNPEGGLSALEYHVLLTLVDAPLYGYAIGDAVERESGGTLTPRTGTLYRVIARLITSGYVGETDGTEVDLRHPGRPRRYYELTGRGRAALANESRRLRGVAALAEKRLGLGRP